MIITNKHGLPESLVEAVKRDKYSFTGDISVTSLIKPPHMRMLERKYIDQCSEDVSDRLWALHGQLMHALLERNDQDNKFIEERLSAEVNGWIVSGQVDLMNETVIKDYKYTSVWSAKQGLKKEWETQLNCLAHLARANGFTPSKLEIVVICRDWRKSESLRYGDDYPRAGFVIDVPLWHPDDTLAWMHNRVRQHKMDNPPICSPEERWDRPEKWAAHKKGVKRAVRLFDKKEDCEAFAEEKKLLVEHRPGESVRCTGYCSVRNFCEYGKSLQEKGEECV